MPSLFKVKRLPLGARFSSRASSVGPSMASSSKILPTSRLAKEGAGVAYAYAVGNFQQPGADEVVTVVEVVPVTLQPLKVEHDVVVKVVVVLPAVLTP